MQKNSDSKYIILIHQYCNKVDAFFKNRKEISLHSRFDNGFNLNLGGEIVYFGQRRGSRAVFISKKDIAKILENIITSFVVNYEQRYLIINDSIKMVFDKGEVVNYSYPANPEVAITLFLEIQRRFEDLNCGFNLSKEALFDILESLGNTRELVNYLIGNGKGLTPSGDDFIMGILAMNRILGVEDDEIRYQIMQSLDKTNDISRAYIQDALQGEFMLEIVELAYGKHVSATMQSIMNHGSTSGSDIILGMLWSLKKGNIWVKK